MGFSISYQTDENGIPQILVSDSSSVRTERNDKGRSCLSFPSQYTVIDVETTGLSPEWDEIIELSAIRYIDGEKTAEFSTLVHPENEIDEYITKLTGITNEMVADAPSISDCIGEYADFLNGDILVGYNVSFDVNFIYDNLYKALGTTLKNDYVDVMRIARKELPELEHHRQRDVAGYFDIKYDRIHRALDDCETCNSCFLKLQNHILERGITLEEFVTTFRAPKHTLHAADITAQTDTFDESHLLFGKVCVFTGALEKMTRAEAMQLVANIGGIPADGVTKKTNFLILGNNDYCKTIKDGKSSKQKKAEQLILNGADLQIIPEQVFYDLI